MAQSGYTVFAIDMYGKGIRPQTNKEAGELSGSFKSNRPLMRSRAQAGLNFMTTLPRVDSKHIVAAGFCFGGGTALELARSGASLTGVVSFHGNLDTPTPEDAKNIKGKVLILHGADDPFVTSKQVVAFQDEMRAAKLDWQLIYFGNAVHAFSDPNAGNHPESGAAYNELAAKRAMNNFQLFLSDLK